MFHKRRHFGKIPASALFIRTHPVCGPTSVPSLVLGSLVIGDLFFKYESPLPSVFTVLQFFFFARAQFNTEGKQKNICSAFERLVQRVVTPTGHTLAAQRLSFAQLSHS
jgi:hypothetical protein